MCCRSLVSGTYSWRTHAPSPLPDLASTFLCGNVARSLSPCGRHRYNLIIRLSQDTTVVSRMTLFAHGSRFPSIGYFFYRISPVTIHPQINPLLGSLSTSSYGLASSSLPPQLLTKSIRSGSQRASLRAESTCATKRSKKRLEKYVGNIYYYREGQTFCPHRVGNRDDPLASHEGECLTDRLIVVDIVTIGDILCHGRVAWIVLDTEKWRRESVNI